MYSLTYILKDCSSEIYNMYAPLYNRVVSSVQLCRDSVPFFNVRFSEDMYWLIPCKYWNEFLEEGVAFPTGRALKSFPIYKRDIISYRFWNKIFYIQDIHQSSDFLKYDRYFKTPMDARTLWSDVIEAVKGMTTTRDIPDLQIDVVYTEDLFKHACHWVHTYV